MTSARRLAGLALLVGCSSPAHPTQPVAELPAATTLCYAGLSKAMGASSRTIVRRTVDPAAHRIVEDVSHDAAGAHGAKSFHVVMTVDGDSFTMAEAAGAFAGTGTLIGERWQWTQWSSTATIPHTSIEIRSDDEVTPTGLRAIKQIHQDGKLLATTEDSLALVDCAQWDQLVTTLAVPALDDAACERACRNYATLKFWQAADAELAQLPEAARESARVGKTTEFAAKVDAGLPACVTQCRSVNNAIQTACIGNAKTSDQLATCE